MLLRPAEMLLANESSPDGHAVWNSAVAQRPVTAIDRRIAVSSPSDRS
jgi:hypothetical protein